MSMRQMPKDTILFLSTDRYKRGLAYDYGYFNENLVLPSSDYQIVYYKAGDTRDTWIDYKRAVQLKSGTKEEIIAKALADPDFLVDFRDIPATYYYFGKDETNKVYYTPYDGYYDNQMWMLRDDTDINLEAINRDTIDASTDVSVHIIYWWDGDDLYVRYPAECSGIDNAIISINMLFLEYVKLDSHNIVYRNLKRNIGKFFGWDEELGLNFYQIKLCAYKWSGLIKGAPLSPVGIVEGSDYFIMPTDMEHNAFVFWNGVYYTYHVSETNPTYILIDGIKGSTFDVRELNDIKVYPMLSANSEMETHIYVHCGFNNRYKNSIDFLLPIYNSCIVYNGVDHEYVVEDDNAIDYIDSSFSIAGNVTFVSEVLSINFTKV